VESEKPFLARYLISSFGFSPDLTLKHSADKNLRPIKSSERVKSVIIVLKEIGLIDTQIRNLITSDPEIHGANAEKTLKPCVAQLIDGGFAEEILPHLILSDPNCLRRKDSLSRIQFWGKFVGRPGKS
jgi:mTERF